ncbi:phosphoenolpyruvate--protein phosphotransferase [Cobetia amphilecti]|uniref:phosphoenolpyruvate--protein phosphotransferase n=1 Tax=Cobetia amphilecti TaxID=1055104 RepID=A0AAP4X284_9GAMM|nr:phosphoenolpyruvate--protein phosphotransferase [Cobetia amphilecti]MDO6672923.1 phosphoenolpyruvate--protein phosphotransferase [Cobetia amphilecti]
MLSLDREDILLAAHASDWRDALQQAADALVAGGRATPDYREGLLAREAQSSTYLGQGIAIPHGTPDSREAVLATGVRVLQFPQGVEWHDGNRVFLLVTIAAQSDEHLDILRALTRVLDRDGVSERLASATTAEEVLSELGREVVPPRLDAETLLCGFPARDRDELVLAGAARLRQAGCVSDGFISAMLAAQPVALGQGVWLAQSQQDVTRSALAIVTPEKALETRHGRITALACLAVDAQQGQHQSLLERLLTLLEEGAGESLPGLSASALLARLSGESATAQLAQVVLLNAHGLHARPAKQLVQAAREAGEQHGVIPALRLEGDDSGVVSAASLTKVLGLGARRGQTLIFSASGDDSAANQAALSMMVSAVQAGLGEAVEPLADWRADAATPLEASEQQATGDTQQAAPAADSVVPAVAASPGMAIAPCWVMRLPRFVYETRSDAGTDREAERLVASIQTAREQLLALVNRAEGAEMAEILSMHEEMLGDPELFAAARESLDEGHSAEAAWWSAIDSAASAQENLADRLLAERAADLRDVGRRVLGVLTDTPLPSAPETPHVLVTEDIGPSDVARLDTTRVRGLVTALGGATSHSAILARSLGIPAVVGAGPSVLAIADGSELIVDGERGRVSVMPSASRRARAEEAIAGHEQRQAAAWESRMAPATTLDGHHVEVVANLGNTAHAGDAVERGAEGVGLLRTEFVFMAHPQAPDLATQTAQYGEALDALEGRPLVARTLDVGGDKPLPYWPLPREDNPFLGLRGIRLALTRPEVLETQVRALLTAAGARPIRLMFPMVKDLAELRGARAIVDRVRAELDAAYAAEHGQPPVRDVQVGVMIEIPSAALTAASIAPEVDFFSVGTNDLTQYTLAIDRGHATLSAQADGLHPAVLRLIEMTVSAAHAHGAWVGVCGELASDDQAVGVLVGLGVDELSVSSRQIPLVKARVRELDLATAREQARVALAQPTSEDVRSALEALLEQGEPSVAEVTSGAADSHADSSAASNPDSSAASNPDSSGYSPRESV